jgi:hypothetical protein
MRQISRRQLLGVVCGPLAVFALASMTWAAGPICFKCKIDPVNMPVSLAVGTVRTPEFWVKDTDYTIMIEVKRGLPLARLDCMMGIRLLGEPDRCATFHLETVLEAEWTVWDGEHIVAQGAVHGNNNPLAAVSDSHLDEYLGTFEGKANKKYVVEVKFTKNGTALNEFKPRLKVQHQEY